MSDIRSRIWNGCEKHPWLFMILAVASQTWFTLSNRALWFSDEVRYANAYQNLVQHGQWMVLSLNGVPYPDKPPVYFWFLWLIDTLTPADMPTVFALGSALSGLLFLFATYILARALEFDRKTAFASILVLLSTFFLVALFHYSRMDLLFGAFITASHACFFRAFSAPTQGKWPLWGFLLAALGTLIKGPLAILFPLLTLVLWLAWRGRIREFFSRPMLIGVSALLGVLALWIAGVLISQGPSFLVDTVIGKHIVQRATHTFHHREPLQYYFIALPLAWLPWTLLPLVLPFKQFGSLKFIRAFQTARKDGNGKNAYLWVMFLGMFTLLSSLSGKVLIYILPIFPALAVLCAQGLLTLSPQRARWFWMLVASLLALGGTSMIFGPDILTLSVPIRGLIPGALILLASSAFLFWRRHALATSNLLCLVLTLIIWLYPIGLLTAPSLDPVMSPKEQALVIKQYAEQGYAPLSYKVYSGIFTYYAGQNLEEFSNMEELQARIANTKKVILTLREKHWERWENRPQNLIPIHHQNIAGSTYVLVLKNQEGDI